MTTASKIFQAAKLWRGGGNIPALAVELENNNIIYFTDPKIVAKALENKDIDLTSIIAIFILKGHFNRIYISANVKISHGSKITYLGNQNKLCIGPNCTFNSMCNINYKGNFNSLIVKNNCNFLSGSKIIFDKNGNFLFIGPFSSLSSVCILNFCGNNAVTYICGKSVVNVSFTHIHSNTIFLLGYESTSNSNFRVESLEGKSIIIGSHCMLSHNITIRNGNGHAIYDEISKMRISKPQSVIIGNHVWIGQDVIISRGNIGEGSIIGAKSLVNKDIPPHCIAAGIPIKIIRKNVLWTRQFPKNSNENKLFESYKDDIHARQDISIDSMNAIDNINIDSPAKEKVNIIIEILHNNYY